jgi:predicted ATP-grasp superfamily ATP-dependent carboligase
MLNGYFDAASEGHVVVTGRKLRQLPPDVGPTSLGICAPNPAVEDMTRRFMKDVGYRGVLDLGYRYDARDGRYKLLDVNPRVGASFRLFACTAGMDVVRALYLDLTGQPIPRGGAQWGRKWLVENFDLSACLQHRRRGDLTARQWLRSLRGVDEVAWSAADDPVPAMAVTRMYLQRAAARRPDATSDLSRRNRPHEPRAPATLVTTDS